MLEWMIFGIIAACIIVIAGIALLFYFLKNPIPIKKSFEELMWMSGYSSIPSGDPRLVSAVSDLSSKVRSMIVPSQSQRERFKVTVVQALTKRLRDEGEHYLCHLKSFVRSGGNISYRSHLMIAEVGSFGVTGEVSVWRRPYPWFEWFIKMVVGTGKRVTTGLMSEFLEKFLVFSKDTNVTLPQRLQQVLIECSSCFPFKQRSGEVTIAYFTPQGWCIVCEKVSRMDLLNELIKTADQISQSLR